jgi:hypothetical protein
MTALSKWFSRRRGRQSPTEEERYFTVDLITSLVLDTCDEFRREEVVARVIDLKRSVTFEMRHMGSVVSTDDEIQAAVGDLLDEGVSNGWIEAVTMRYPEGCRQDVPLRLREELAESPSLKGTLRMILAKVGLPPLDERSRARPDPSSKYGTSRRAG